MKECTLPDDIQNQLCGGTELPMSLFPLTVVTTPVTPTFSVKLILFSVFSMVVSFKPTSTALLDEQQLPIVQLGAKTSELEVYFISDRSILLHNYFSRLKPNYRDCERRVKK